MLCLKPWTCIYIYILLFFLLCFNVMMTRTWIVAQHCLNKTFKKKTTKTRDILAELNVMIMKIKKIHSKTCFTSPCDSNMNLSTVGSHIPWTAESVERVPSWGPAAEAPRRWQPSHVSIWFPNTCFPAGLPDSARNFRVRYVLKGKMLYCLSCVCGMTGLRSLWAVI